MTFIRVNGADRASLVWTDQNIKQLRTFAGKKLSASDIAAEIGGGVTRSAVAGKAARLGIKLQGGTPGGGRGPGANAGSAWTAQKLSEFHELYTDGLGDGAIATGLGAPFTRKMVQGKRKNLGLPSHFASPATRSATRSTPKRTKLKSGGTLASYFAPTQPKLRPEPVDAQPIRVTIDQLTSASCRWPLGDPGDLDAFRYCGARVDLPGIVPYCAGHTRLAYARAA